LQTDVGPAPIDLGAGPMFTGVKRYCSIGSHDALMRTHSFGLIPTDLVDEPEDTLPVCD
jgi:hypothetical protein